MVLLFRALFCSSLFCVVSLCLASGFRVGTVSEVSVSCRSIFIVVGGVFLLAIFQLYFGICLCD